MSISRNRELDALEGGRTRFEAKVKHGECGECVCVCVSPIVNAYIALIISLTLHLHS